MQNLAAELEQEQAYVSLLYRRLDTLRERTQAELERALGYDGGGNVQARVDRDAFVARHSGRLAQLASNLLSNAVTHGAPDQPIRFEATSNGGLFTLSVANAGEPIPEEARSHLFQPFFRGEARPSRNGLGLGLFIACQIAKAHDGTLEVSSNEEETRFTFKMPMGN